MIKLTEAPCDMLLEIRSLKGGRGWEKRFDSLGIREGRRMRKIACQPLGGPVVIEVEGSKISLGRTVASRIGVEIVEPSCRS